MTEMKNRFIRAWDALLGRSSRDSEYPEVSDWLRKGEPAVITSNMFVRLSEDGMSLTICRRDGWPIFAMSESDTHFLATNFTFADLRDADSRGDRRDVYATTHTAIGFEDPETVSNV